MVRRTQRRTPSQEPRRETSAENLERLRESINENNRVNNQNVPSNTFALSSYLYNQRDKDGNRYLKRKIKTGKPSKTDIERLRSAYLEWLRNQPTGIEVLLGSMLFQCEVSERTIYHHPAFSLHLQFQTQNVNSIASDVAFNMVYIHNLQYPEHQIITTSDLSFNYRLNNRIGRYKQGQSVLFNTAP